MGKLGPHCILASAQALEWAKRAPIVKAFDGQGQHLPILRAAQPNALVVFRHWMGNNASLGDPEGAAHQVIAALQGFRHPRLFVELWNEQNQDVATGLAGHIDAVRRATVVLHEAGLKVAGFSFSTGNPIGYPGNPEGNADAWALLQSEGYAGVDAIALHEYWGGQGFTLWNALRHRQVRKWAPDCPPFLITECGRDLVEGGLGGWKRDVPPGQYLFELMAYDDELEKDDDVLGAVVFTAGPTSDWDRFSTDGLATSPFSGLPPRTSWVPPHTEIPVLGDETSLAAFNHDTDTEAKLEELGWTPQSDGVAIFAPRRKATGTYQVECAEGTLIYAYATGEWLVRPNA